MIEKSREVPLLKKMEKYKFGLMTPFFSQRIQQQMAKRELHSLTTGTKRERCSHRIQRIIVS